MHACIHIILQGFIYWGGGGGWDNTLSHKSLNSRLLKLSQVAKCLRFCASYRRGHIPLQHPHCQQWLPSQIQILDRTIIIWQSGSTTSLVYHMHCIATNCRDGFAHCSIRSQHLLSYLLTNTVLQTRASIYFLPGSGELALKQDWL